MRTFIALDFDKAVKDQLAALEARLKPRCPKLKWVEPAQIHLTLKFLGEITQQQAAPVTAALNNLAAQCRPFDIAIEDVGCFPPSGGVDVVWVGIKDATGRLAECQARCEDLIEPLGFPRERRRFAPHLTLARNRDRANGPQIRDALKQEGPLHVGRQTVGAITFYQSTLTPSGPIYKALSKHPLSV
jgi:2'-5' RNA ligase